jgi:hypothetical protein
MAIVFCVARKEIGDTERLRADGDRDALSFLFLVAVIEDIDGFAPGDLTAVAARVRSMYRRLFYDQDSYTTRQRILVPNLGRVTFTRSWQRKVGVDGFFFPDCKLLSKVH